MIERCLVQLKRWSPSCLKDLDFVGDGGGVQVDDDHQLQDQELALHEQWQKKEETYVF